MASDGNDVVSVEQDVRPKLQIYSPPSSTVSPFWREKYERDAKKYWDIFYKRHQDKFFKDRHYLDKEWGSYFHGEGRKVVLEVGCGVGNAVFPLVASYPDIFVHACDFSPRAVDLVKAHKDFMVDRVNPFVCDVTQEDLSNKIAPFSVDIVTMIFVLSAISPEKMPFLLQNIGKVLKPNGHVLFRDYAVGDLAQERLTCKDQQISENFFVRGDGTRAFYFSEDFLTSLFKRNGFDAKEVGMCCKQVENRARELVMNRRWIQAIFCPFDAPAIPKTGNQLEPHGQEINDTKLNNGYNKKQPANGIEVDMSEGIALEMFGISQSVDDVTEINLGNFSFRIKGLPKEFQHTCKSTGLILWESSRLMSTILAENPSIVAGKKVLELGCGSAGICSMVAVRSADLLVATDGDPKTLDLLQQNVLSNLEPVLLKKLVTEKLEWGNRDQIESIKKLCPEGFQVIIGTDVTYVTEAMPLLFETARFLISDGGTEGSKPALILCHIVRRVDEASILRVASQFGFRPVDRLVTGKSARSLVSSSNGNTHGGIISSWLSSNSGYDHGKRIFDENTAVNIMYFHL
ncbi:S-adenosyl-L-methionine-dependent methyltransferases superfamily protein [Tasmannia lanceolata]|uniref:S-adenosyl-L-methionine-dependent methyltransferases superfamily protein n=1 Tax=Tasmannia lanceolata TaxID=3420 RepID=UPI00406350F5